MADLLIAILIAILVLAACMWIVRLVVRLFPGDMPRATIINIADVVFIICFLAWILRHFRGVDL